MTILGSFGKMIKLLGYVGWTVFGLWGFIICLSIVNSVAGFWGVVLGFTIAPVTFLVAPWYALIAWGNPLPLIVGYGGGILSTCMFALGSWLEERATPIRA